MAVKRETNQAQPQQFLPKYKQSELGFSGFAVQAVIKSASSILWYVSDEGLMTEFYQKLKTAPLKAEALKQAQLGASQCQQIFSCGVGVSPAHCTCPLYRAGRMPTPQEMIFLPKCDAPGATCHDSWASPLARGTI